MLTDENAKMVWDIFKEYEAKFGKWLYCAWDFDSVDWEGLAKAAAQSIKNNSPLTDEQIELYHGEKLKEGQIL